MSKTELIVKFDNEEKIEDHVQITFGLPCYNTAPYIRACVESIIMQEFPFEYEILCIDDASTDNTVQVIRELTTQYNCVYLYENKENSGVSVTRNRIIELSRGKYIWFVDPDERLFPGAVNKVYELAMGSNADYCCGNYVEYLRGTEPDDNTLLSTYDANGACAEKIGKNWIPLTCNQNGAVGASACCGIWKRAFLNANKLRFAPGITVMEDMLFKLSTEAYDRTIAWLDYPVYIYLVRAGSATTDNSNQKRINAFLSRKASIGVMEQISRLSDSAFENKVKRLMIQATEDMVILLTTVPNFRFVRDEMSKLKAEGYYPYTFRKNACSGVRGINNYLMPISLVFWLNWFARWFLAKMKHK